MKYPSQTSSVGGLNLGAGPADSTAAFISTYINLKSSNHYSLFLIGVQNLQPWPHPPKLWSCDETSSYDGLFADCGEPIAVNVSMFQPNLTDIFTDYIDERRDQALSAIAQSKTDILCLSELYSPDIQRTLKGKSPII